MKKHTKFKGFAAGVVVALAGSLFSIQAVSYTHLDVYKRQMMALVLPACFLF